MTLGDGGAAKGARSWRDVSTARWGRALGVTAGKPKGICGNVYVAPIVAPIHSRYRTCHKLTVRVFAFPAPAVLGDLSDSAKLPSYTKIRKRHLCDTLENATACALVKEMQFLTDCHGEQFNLSYVRTKDGREIDFLVSREDFPQLLLEVKWANNRPSGNFSSFEKYFPGIKQTQIVKELDREKTYPSGLEIRQTYKWLVALSLFDRYIENH